MLNMTVKINQLNIRNVTISFWLQCLGHSIC